MTFDFSISDDDWMPMMAEILSRAMTSFLGSDMVEDVSRKLELHGIEIWFERDVTGYCNFEFERL
jgi:hypothetical protein